MSPASPGGELRVATGKPVGATIHDAVVAAEIVDAMIASSEQGGWVTL